MRKIFLAIVYLVSFINIVSAADILSCQSEIKYHEMGMYEGWDKGMAPIKAGVCRHPYMTVCDGPIPDTTQHYDVPVSSMKATDLEYRSEGPVPGSEQDDGHFYTPPTQFLLSVNRTDGSFVIRWTKPWSRLHDPNDVQRQMEASKGPISSINEYTGHCELKHVETKF